MLSQGRDIQNTDLVSLSAGGAKGPQHGRSKSFGTNLNEVNPADSLFHATGTPFKGHGNNPVNSGAPPLLQQQQQQQQQPQQKPHAQDSVNSHGKVPGTPQTPQNANLERMAPLTTPRKPPNRNSFGGSAQGPAPNQAPSRNGPSNAPGQSATGRPGGQAAAPARPKPNVQQAPNRQGANGQPAPARPASGQQNSGLSNLAPGVQQKPNRKPEPPKNPADEVGHYQVKQGSMIDFTPPFTKGRYHVLKQLGSGTYGKVVLCEDNKYKKAHVAVKLVRSTPHLYRLSAKNEIKILRDLDGKNCTVKLLRDFEHQGHVSMTFELLGESLSEVAARGPLKTSHVRDVAMQLLQALAYTHSKKIIHSDVKTENVLVVSQSPSTMVIKLVDFGSALYNSAWHPPLVGTMHYRAPEAVLQAGWSYSVDLWAVGCILVELATGEQLFELAHDDVHLAMMERVLGPIPADLMRKGYANNNQYNRGLLLRDQRGMVRLAPCRPDGYHKVRQMGRLCDYVKDPALLDLCRRLFEYDPTRRITAAQALNHHFFDTLPDEIAEEVPERIAVPESLAPLAPLAPPLVPAGVPNAEAEAAMANVGNAMQQVNQQLAQLGISTHDGHAHQHYVQPTIARTQSQPQTKPHDDYVAVPRRASMAGPDFSARPSIQLAPNLSPPLHHQAPPIAPLPLPATAEDSAMFPATAEDVLALAAAVDQELRNELYGDSASGTTADDVGSRGSFSARGSAVGDDEVRGDYPEQGSDWDWGRKMYDANSGLPSVASASSMASTLLHMKGDSPPDSPPAGSATPREGGELSDYPASGQAVPQQQPRTAESVQNSIQAKVLSGGASAANILSPSKMINKAAVASPKIAAPHLLLTPNFKTEAML